jgi:hypothetical protein
VAVVCGVEQFRCAKCASLFVLCPSCFRGQAYCSLACRHVARLGLHRAANARHQRSKEGRLDHRDRMRAYRRRRLENASAGFEAAVVIEAFNGAVAAPQATTETPTEGIAAAVAAASVTDATSEKLDSPVECHSRDSAIACRSLYASALKTANDDDDGRTALLRCRVCGVLGTHIVRRRSRVPP